MDRTAVRDKRGDFRVVPLDKLKETIQSTSSTRRKAQLLLTEIGYLRCNLFAEYYERIKRFEGKNELNRAAELMQEYSEIAIPFVSTKKQRVSSWRIKGLLLRKNQHEEPDRIRDWKDRYKAWSFKTGSIDFPTNNLVRIEEFTRLQNAFLTLYTYSFSVDNFPPLRNRRSDRLI